MKKRIIVIILATLMLLTACGKASDTPAPTDDTQPTSESTPTQSTNAPAEPPTSAPTDVPTEPAATEPTPAPTEPEPEPSKDDLSYYPYPLLDMTYGEIEAIYGELTVDYSIAGGACPDIPQLKIVLETGVPVYEEIPATRKSVNIRLMEPLEYPIYPGLNVGMRANEIPQNIEWDEGWFTSGHDDGFSRYAISANVDSYCIYVYFKIPPDLLDKYGLDIDLTEEEYQQHKAWGDEYRKNIFDQDITINEIVISKKRS